MKLYSYFRSSAAFRVRIALNLKGLPYDVVPVHLVKGGGDQLTPEYRRLSPDGLVPTLVDGPTVVTQSLAIIEYLDELHPSPPLLPQDAAARAYVRGVALAVACDIHPLNNLRVMRYLGRELKATQEQKDAWYRHWCEQGLAAMEVMLAQSGRAGRFCYGDTPGLADCFMTPQVANAKRVNCDLSGMPTINRIHDACMSLNAFMQAAPALQPDAE